MNPGFSRGFGDLDSPQSAHWEGNNCACLDGCVYSRPSSSQSSTRDEYENVPATQGRGKRKCTYEKWTREEECSLVDLWVEKHDRLGSKDARKTWCEISDEIEMNAGTKKHPDKCVRKMKYLTDKYNDAKSWNKTHSGIHMRKSHFYDRIDAVLGSSTSTGDVGGLEHDLEAGSGTRSRSPSPSASPSLCRDRQTSRGKRKLESTEDSDDEKAVFKKTMDALEKQGEKVTEVMQRMQEMHRKELEMMASFMGSLLEVMKDKKQ